MARIFMNDVFCEKCNDTPIIYYWDSSEWIVTSDTHRKSITGPYTLASEALVGIIERLCDLGLPPSNLIWSPSSYLFKPGAYICKASVLFDNGFRGEFLGELLMVGLTI